MKLVTGKSRFPSVRIPASVEAVVADTDSVEVAVELRSPLVSIPGMEEISRITPMLVTGVARAKDLETIAGMPEVGSVAVYRICGERSQNERP